MGNQVWAVVYGDGGTELPSVEGPFVAGADALYATERRLIAEGWELVAVLPWHAWDAMTRGWTNAVADAVETVN